jgi:ABC-type transport system involved in multi-copper enzyme maturation permease subunit
MTVLTLETPNQTTLRPLRWRRMVWVTWRQQRGTLISVPAVLGAIALFLVIAGLIIHHNYAVLASCHPGHSNTCANLNNQFNHGDWTIGNAVDIFLNLAPVVIGAFAGAPLLAREVETGTYRFAWTQGFGRERWVTAKLVLIGGALAINAAAFSQVFAWFFQPFLRQEQLTVMSTVVFDLRPIVFAGWTLVAFAIGACAGILIRRTVPALAVTIAVYAGLGIAMWALLQTNSMATSRFWSLQLIEGGALLALAVLLTAARVWLVRRRAA